MDSTTILLLRHAEKPGPVTGMGINAMGYPDESSLAVRGWQRSGALAQLLSNGMRFEFSAPRKIFAAQPTDRSRRCADTVAALSEKLRMATETGFGRGDEQCLARSIESTKGTILVCWQHDGLATIARCLVGDAMASSVPTAWPEDRFDMIWKLERGHGHWRFVQFSQRLLSGDTGAAIR